jgi:hypothetical protein
VDDKLLKGRGYSTGQLQGMLSGAVRADIPNSSLDYFQFVSVQCIFQEQVEDGIEKQNSNFFLHAYITKIT